MNEKQEYIIKKLNDIADISQELMNIAITGDDGNLEEMSYHIKCYVPPFQDHTVSVRIRRYFPFCMVAS